MKSTRIQTIYTSRCLVCLTVECDRKTGKGEKMIRTIEHFAANISTTFQEFRTMHKRKRLSQETSLR